MDVIRDPRRHDLDAVRSFAMLLGIALHAALAYIGGVWIVSDERASEGLGVFVAAVHGFRMPLFFLLSGFFTAMLWKRRGLGGLLGQRTKRIVLPLILGCSMIVPTMYAVSSWAIGQRTQQIQASADGAVAGEEKPRAPSADIWTVASYGDMEGLRAYTRGHEQLDAQDPMYGVTALGWTVVKNQPEAAAYLLEVGADPSAAYKDGNTPMHTAGFFGRADIAEHLIRHGADLSRTNPAGEVPMDSMRHNQQTTEFIANMLAVPIVFADVASGRERIRVMIEEAQLAAAAVAETDELATTHQAATAGGGGLIARLQGGSFFHHLWFLWFLCWLNAGFAVVVLVGSVLPRVKLPAVLVASPLALVWLVPMTMVFQLQMHAGGSQPGFGPDTSAGLVPMWHVLAYYAVFFGFGAVVYSVRGSGARLGRFWYVSLPVAVMILPMGLVFGYEPARAAEWVADESTRHWVSSVLQVVYVWLMTFGLLGLCETVLNKDRAWVRFVSDSSYWLYLVHLPLVVLGQGLLLRTGLPALVEFGILLVATSAVLLVSYRYLVRYTVIGLLLNGRRTRGTLGSCNPEPLPSVST